MDGLDQGGGQERPRVEAAVDQDQVARAGGPDRLGGPAPLGQLPQHVHHTTQVGQLPLPIDPGQDQRLGVGGLGVGLGEGADLELVDVGGEGVAVAVPDRPRPVGDQPEAAPVEQAGGAAVDGGRRRPGGRVAAELDQRGVVGELEGGGVGGADRLVGRVVDPGPVVGEEPAEVAGGLPHPVGIVLGEQRASLPRTPERTHVLPGA